MPSYQKNKVAIYNWREKNIDAFRNYHKIWTRKNRMWKKIQKEFLGILID